MYSIPRTVKIPLRLDFELLSLDVAIQLLQYSSVVEDKNISELSWTVSLEEVF